jgi:hypothetical protein
MTVIVYSKQEREYQAWVRRNPSGYVINTRRGIDPEYMVLHRSTCPSIRDYAANTARDAFTGRGYVKACGESLTETTTWALRVGRGITKRCSRCKP